MNLLLPQKEEPFPLQPGEPAGAIIYLLGRQICALNHTYDGPYGVWQSKAFHPSATLDQCETRASSLLWGALEAGEGSGSTACPALSCYL